MISKVRNPVLETFAVRDALFLKECFNNLSQWPQFWYEMVFITFAAVDLENPETEPIGFYYRSGNRCYLWRDQCWSEFALDVPEFKRLVSRRLHETLVPLEVYRMIQLDQFLDAYKISRSPSVVALPIAKNSERPLFYRVLYLLNE